MCVMWGVCVCVCVCGTQRVVDSTDAELSASLNTFVTIGEPHIEFSQSENLHFGPASPGALVS